MKKKIEECENIEFLPDAYRDSTDLNQSEKNVLATLCYCYLRYSDYVAEHNGWFFTSGKELEQESGIDVRTVYRILVKLKLKGLIKSKSGTNHKCTHYKLNPKITELLTKSEDFEESEEANVTLEEKRRDESSPDETRRDESSSFGNKRKFNVKMTDEIQEEPVDDFDYSDVDPELVEEYEMAIEDSLIPSEIGSQHPLEGAAPLPETEKTETEIEQEKERERQDFLKKKLLVIDRIRKEASGKTYSEITRLTIPMYNWVSGEFPEYSDSFKRVVDNTLYRVKDELRAAIPSSTPAHQDDYPFL